MPVVPEEEWMRTGWEIDWCEGSVTARTVAFSWSNERTVLCPLFPIDYIIGCPPETLARDAKDAAVRQYEYSGPCETLLEGCN